MGLCFLEAGRVGEEKNLWEVIVHNASSKGLRAVGLHFLYSHPRRHLHIWSMNKNSEQELNKE